MSGDIRNREKARESLYDATGDIDLEAVVDYVFQAIDETETQ